MSHPLRFAASCAARSLVRASIVLSVLLLSSPSFAQLLAPQSMTLDDALTLAEKQSEQLVIARAGVDRAKSTVRRTRSDLFPQIDATASYDRTLDSEFRGIFDNIGSSGDQTDEQVEGDLSELPFGRDNAYRLSVSFSQNLWSGGRVGARQDQAEANLANADLNVMASNADVERQVALAFYDAALSDRLVTIAELTLQQADDTLRQTELAWKVGNQSEFEVLRARVTRDSQQPVVIRQRANRDVAHLRLKQLLDLPAQMPLALTVTLDDVTGAPAMRFAASLAEAEAGIRELDRVPVQQAAADVEAQEAAVDIALAERRPRVSLTSSYAPVSYTGILGFNNYRTNWTVGVNMSISVLNGGRLAADVQIARAQLTETEARLQQTRELAWLETNTAYAEYTAARAAWEASAGTIEQAQRAYEIAELRFREGLSTQLELSDARLQLQQAQANRAQAARDFQLTRVRLALLPDLPLSTSTTPQIQTTTPQPVAAPATTTRTTPTGVSPGAR